MSLEIFQRLTQELNDLDIEDGSIYIDKKSFRIYHSPPLTVYYELKFFNGQLLNSLIFTDCCESIKEGLCSDRFVCQQCKIPTCNKCYSNVYCPNCYFAREY